MFANRTYRTRISAGDIEGVQFERKLYNTWMILKLNESLSPDSYICNDYNPTTREVSFILSHDVDRDNMQDRFRKAFSSLSEMCGGKAFYRKEAY